MAAILFCDIHSGMEGLGGEVTHMFTMVFLQLLYSDGEGMAFLFFC